MYPLKLQSSSCIVTLSITVIAWCDDLINMHFPPSWRARLCLACGGVDAQFTLAGLLGVGGVLCERQGHVEQCLALLGGGVCAAGVVPRLPRRVCYGGSVCFQVGDVSSAQIVIVSMSLSPVTSFLVQPHSCTPAHPRPLRSSFLSCLLSWPGF